MATVEIPRLWQPSIKSGFAHSAAESQNPGLWDQLLGAWIPGFDGGLALHNQVTGAPVTVGAGLVNTDKTRFKGVACIDFTEAQNKSLGIANVWGKNPRLTDTTVFQRVNFDSISNYEACFSQTPGTGFISGRNTGIIYCYSAGNIDGPVTGAVNGTWYSACIAIRAGGVSPIGTFYVDGIPGTPTARNTPSEVSDFIIGAEGTTDGWSMDGKIAESYMWDRILTPAEIKQMSRDPLAPFQLKPLTISLPAAAPPAGDAMPMAAHYYQTIRGM